MNEIKDRGVKRASFTRELTALEEQIGSKAELTTINARFGLLTQKYSKLKELDAAIFQEMLKDENKTVDELLIEENKCDEYTFKYLEMKEKVEELNNVETEVMPVPVPPPSSQNTQPVPMTSPFAQFTTRREIRKFDGDLRNWIGFWTQFRRTHENETIPIEDKFDLLLQHLKPDSAADKLIRNIPPSKENYLKAVDLLESRFGREELLIEHYVREILRLVSKKNQNIPVSEIYDNLEPQLRALDSLGTTKDRYAAILFPMVESAVPDHVFKIWERHRVNKGASIKDPTQCLTELLDFLKIEVESEQRLRLREDFDRPPPEEKVASREESNRPATAAALVVGSASDACIFCDKGHKNPQDCSSAAEMSLQDRCALVKKKGACFRCLKKAGHVSAKCNHLVKCCLCKGKHYPVVCNKGDLSSDKAPDSKEKAEETVAAMSAADVKGSTYLQTLQASVVTSKEKSRVRILLDGGSQRSYITKNCVKKFQLRQCGKVEMTQKLFGGRETSPRFYGIYKVNLESLDGSFSSQFTLLGQDCICDFVPQVTNRVLYKKLDQEGINLTDFDDMGSQRNNQIDILLGSDSWPKLVTGQYTNVHPDLVAIKTSLGWTLSGAVPPFSNVASSLLVTLTCQTHLSNFWDLELMGIKDPSVKKQQNQKDAEVNAFFEKTVRRREDGRVVVKLPWIEHPPQLENNRATAEKRLWSTTRKLERMGRYDDYDGVLKEWLALEIIEEVVESEYLQGTHYLPHRAVIKDSASTRVRPVFDASNKDENGISLNMLLEAGPNLIELVPSILTNFRMNKIGITADVEKAFLQIVVDPSERDLLRFLWWKDGKIITLRHCRVVFGVSSSPFLLAAVLNYVLENAPNEHKKLAEKLQKSFYVDNLLNGVETEEELESFITGSKKLMSSAGFNLRSWVDNIHNPDNVEKILGMKWFCGSDVIGCNSELLGVLPTTTTRRTLFSVSQRIYDQIGFTAPISLLPKVLVQKTWSLDLKWDDVLPLNISDEFLKWASEVPACLDECKIPRRIIINDTSTIHVFCDASKIAYACCVFVRTQVECDIHISLIMAKTRVAPNKDLTMPRLELMAAVIGVRIYNLAREGMHCDLPAYFWSDSTVVLGWIQGGGVWSVFVHNRVKEILETTDASQWRHVPGNLNPADLLSRGCSPCQLKDSRWWEGPTWLRLPMDDWPVSAAAADPELLEAERRKTVIAANVITKEEYYFARLLAQTWSSYRVIVKRASTIIDFLFWKFNRFYDDFKESFVVSGPLPEEEKFATTELLLFRAVQRECFTSDTKRTVLRNCTVFEDYRKILHLKTRLLDDGTTEEYRLPIILPAKHPLIVRLIEEEHRQNHAGTLSMMVRLRERFWLLNGRKVINSVVRKCVICQRHRAKPLEVPFPPLPRDRTTISPTFHTTGLDLAGPLYLDSGEKAWVVIFTCAVYRAVHLELVQSLSSEALIQALRRFISRRGRPVTLYSDNGTNFVGLENALSELDWSKISEECDLRRIKWKFNAPTAAWWGGFWERLIRILKDLLKRNIGRAHLNLNEMTTLLCECEGIMNERPLTYVSEDPSEILTLTPSMFLISLTNSHVDDLDTLEARNLQSRWCYLQNVRHGLRSRFKKEYLGFLRTSKNMAADTVNIGDIVLISNEKKRLFWPLGKVMEVFPGRDGITRVARLKTATGELVRPFQRLYPLELDCTKTPDEVPCDINENSPDQGSAPALRNTEDEVRRSDEEHRRPDELQDLAVAGDIQEDGSDAPPAIDLISSSDEEDEETSPDSIPPTEEMVTRRGRIVKPRERLDL